MPVWIFYSCLVIIFWGVVGLFQKLGSNRMSPKGIIVWMTVGYILLVPWLLTKAGLNHLGPRDIAIGVVGGLTNGLGAWYLFASLDAGAKASVAVPLTALNPLLTILLAMVILSERLTPLQWFGVVLAVVAGVMISYETQTSQ
jgi:bacterial/archaeal transporter family protein